MIYVYETIKIIYIYIIYCVIKIQETEISCAIRVTYLNPF